MQLSGAQLEEAKEEAKLLTAGKMKIYRKDRLFASDKEKTECLQDVLKNVRITDENAFFAQTKAQDSPVSTPTNNNVQRNNVVGPRGG